MSKNQQHEGSHKVGVGLGIAALAAAAAGIYYLYGSDKSAKNRKHVKSWMLRMKAEVMDEIEDIKDLTQEKYQEAIDKVSGKYAMLKSIDHEELKELAERMKSHWQDIQEDIKDTVVKEVKKAEKHQKR